MPQALPPYKPIQKTPCFGDIIDTVLMFYSMGIPNAQWWHSLRHTSSQTSSGKGQAHQTKQRCCAVQFALKKC